MMFFLFILVWWLIGAFVSFLFFHDDRTLTDSDVIVILMLCVPFGVLLPIVVGLLRYADESDYL